MPFVTKLDYSNNRQIKQFQLTSTNLSGTTVFGLDYSGLTAGVNLDTVITTGFYSNIVSTFSGNSTTTIFSFGQPEMVVGAETLIPITSGTSGDTQVGLGYEGIDPTIIDGNTVYGNYTGSTYDLDVTSIEEVGVNQWTGTTNSTTVTLLSGASSDFNDRTIWVDVRGITQTKRLILTDELEFPNSSIDVLGRTSGGDVVGVALSGLTGGTGPSTDDYVDAASFNLGNGELTLERLSGGTVIVDLDGRYSLLGGGGGSGDVVTGMTFNTSDGVLTLTTLSGVTITEDLDGRYLTGFTDTNDYVTGGTFDISTADLTLNRLSGTSLDISFETVVAKNTADIGSVIPLDTQGGHNANLGTANTTTSYTLNNTLDIINAYTRVLINATTEPTISGATKEGGVAFEANTDLYLIVWNKGVEGVVYYFVPVDESNFGSNADDYVTGGTVTGSNLQLIRLSGGTVDIDVSSLTGGTGGTNTDDYVTGGTFDISTADLTLDRLSGGTFDISFETVVAKNTADIGSVIPLDTQGGHNGNLSSANATTSYTLNNTLDIINAYARVLINATTEPTISGATKEGGVAFEANTDLYLIVWNKGVEGVVYYFVPVDESNFGSNADDYVTSGTVTGSNLQLTRLSGGTVDIDVSSLTGGTGGVNTDDYTTGATFNDTTGILEFTRQSGDTYSVDIDGRYALIDNLELPATQIAVGNTTGITSYTGFTWNNSIESLLIDGRVDIIDELKIQGAGGGGQGLAFNTSAINNGIYEVRLNANNEPNTGLNFGFTGGSGNYTTTFWDFFGNQILLMGINTFRSPATTIANSQNPKDIIIREALEDYVTQTTSGFTSNTDDYISSGSFNTGNGEVTLTRLSGGTVVYDLDGRYLLESNFNAYTGSTSGDTVIEDTYIAVGTGTGIEGTSGFTWDNTNMFIDGNLGIGTDTPDTQLHIQNGNVAKVLIEGDTGGGANNDVYLGFKSRNIHEWSIGINSDTFHITNGDGLSTPLMTILNTGDVGIGTEAPDEILHIIDADPNIKLEDSTASVRADLNTELGFYTNTNALGSYIGHRNSADLELRSTSGSLKLGNFTTTSLLNLIGGNVLVGTTSSTGQKFQVNGNALSHAWITSGGTVNDFVKGDGSLDSNTYLTGFTYPMVSKTETIPSSGLNGIGTLKEQVRDYINSLGYVKDEVTSDLWFKAKPPYILNSGVEANISPTNQIMGLSVTSGGTYFYIGYHNSLLRQYTASTAWDVTTLTEIDSEASLGQGGPLHVTSDGSHLLYSDGDNSDGIFELYEMTTPHDLSTLNLLSTRQFNLPVSRNEGFITDDGLQLYFATQTTVYHYTLSTAWVLSGATLSESFNTVGNSLGFAFNKDLTKLYISASGANKNFEQYGLSIAGDLSTATLEYTTSFSSLQTCNFTKFNLSPDGYKMVITSYCAPTNIEAWTVTLSEPNQLGSFFVTNDVEAVEVYDSYYRLINFSAETVSSVTLDDLDEITPIKIRTLSSGTTSNNTDDFTTGATFNDTTGIIEFTRQSGSTYNVDLGFTSGDTTNWNDAFDDSITGITVTGTVSKTITFQQRDGSTLTANFTDDTGGGGSGDVVTGMTFNTSDGVLTLSTLSGATITEDLDGRYVDLFDNQTVGGQKTFTAHTIFDNSISIGTPSDITNVGIYNALGDFYNIANFKDVRFLFGEALSGGLWGGMYWQRGNNRLHIGHSGDQTNLSTISINDLGDVAIGGGSRDATEKLDVDGNIISDSFITNGGTVNDFVKGDGSLDSNTYITNFNIQANGGTQVNISANEEINFINGDATEVIIVNQTNPTVQINHKITSSQASSNNSGRTYIQDITLDAFGHVTGLETASETVVNTDNYVTGTTFNTGNGILTLSRNGLADLTQDLDGRYALTSDLNSYVTLSTTQTISGLKTFTNASGIRLGGTSPLQVNDISAVKYDTVNSEILLGAVDDDDEVVRVVGFGGSSDIEVGENVINLNIGGNSKVSVSGSRTTFSDGIGSLPTIETGTVALFQNNDTVTDNVKLQLVAGTGSTESAINFGNTTNQDAGKIRYDHSNDELIFWTNNAQRMVLDNVGNLGLGTTSPNERLQVQGNILASGNIVGISGLRKTIDDKSGNYTIVSTDRTKIIRTTGASNIDITVNTGSLTNIGEMVEIDHWGTGDVTIVAGTATLRVNALFSLISNGTYSRIYIQKITSTEYRVWGDLQ